MSTDYKDYNDYSERDKLALLIEKIDALIKAIEDKG